MVDNNFKYLSKDQIKKLIIHCSDTPDDNYLSAIDIHTMHINFGWNGIGYHKVIRRDGVIENGRPEYWIGAHTYGMNEISLGVCLIGKKEFTTDQFNSLKQLLINWKETYPNAEILGHSDAIITDKTCPNFDVKKWCEVNSL